MSQAERRRRRRHLAVAGATVLAVAAVAGGIAATTDDRGRDVQPAPQEPSPSATAPPADADYQDLPVWWSPDLDEELDLPWLRDSPLPRQIDLSADVPDVSDEPIDRAVAAFGLDHEVVLVAPDGTLRRLAVDLDQPATDADGYEVSPYGPSMLSPDGRRLVFPQDGHRSLYDLATHEWSQLDAGSAETAHVLSPPLVLDLPEAMRNPYGPERTVVDSGATRSAQSWGMGPGIPIRESGVYFGGPAYLVVTGGPDRSSILAFMTGVDDVRWMDAPPVAGWLGSDTLVYESVAEDRDLLIAWDVGTHRFRRVASATPGWQSSFARLS